MDNSKISENYVLVSSINDIKKIDIPNPYQLITVSDNSKDNLNDKNGYLIIDKNNYNWNNHSINVIINPQLLLRDLRKHLRTSLIVKKNFEVDMPRTKFFINQKRIVNFKEAINIISKNKNYKDILRLSTASALGLPYELIYSSYKKFEKNNSLESECLHLSDSVPKSIIVNVNLFEDGSSEINTIKILQLMKVSDYDTPMGIITLKLSTKLSTKLENINDSKSCNECILFWNYSTLSSV
jgi:hypothetical protein